MENEQLLGASNKFFYYAMSQGASFNIRIELTVPGLEPEKLKEAFSEALRYYPEMAVQVVIKDNKLTSVRNDAPILLTQDDRTVRHFGTKDTNGYLFYVICREDGFTFSYYHGMTDVAGILEFIRCVMYLYAKRTGFAFTREEIDEIEASIRLDEKVFREGDKEDLLDPYNAHKDAGAIPEFILENEAAFDIPATTYPDEAEYIHESIITVKTSEVLAKTKEFGVSVMPFLTDVCSMAIRKEYCPGQMPVIAMVPVNLRPFLNSKTTVNCSDGVMIPVHEEDEELGIRERCLKWKDLLRKQMSENAFKKLIASKAGAVETFENEEVPIAFIAKEMTKVSHSGESSVLSYAMTYPGNLSLLSGLDRMVEDCRVKGLTRANAVIVHSFKENMRLQIICRTDDNRLAECIAKAFSDINISSEMIDNKRVFPDLMLVEELEDFYGNSKQG